LFLVSTVVGFIFILPVQSKKKTLNLIGVSVRTYRSFSTNLIIRYSTIFFKTDYDFLYEKIWIERFDPKDPVSGWGTRNSFIEFPLYGENAAIVPANSKGYRMDRSCDASSWDNNAYSYTDISHFFEGDYKLRFNEFFYSSVYCFVSKDFNGDWARISVEGNDSGQTMQEYDLKKKGTWQKLSIWFTGSKSLPPVYLYWAKNGVTNFADLKGYIVYAFPEYKKSIPNLDPAVGWGSRIYIPEYHLSGTGSESIPQNAIGYKMNYTSNASTWNGNAYSYTAIKDLYKVDSSSVLTNVLSASVYCLVSKDFDGTWVNLSAEGNAYGEIIQEYDLTKKGTWQKLQLNFKCDTGIPPVYLYWSKYGVTDFSSLKGYVIFAYPEYFNGMRNSKLGSSHINLISSGSYILKSSVFSPQMIHLFISKIKTTYFIQDSIKKQNEELFLKKLEKNEFSGARTSRWYYCWIIFKDYPIQKKLFGGGFDYMKMFGSKFGGGEYDYPHNPFISAFLYSGILGGFAYLWFMFMSIFYYIKYYKYHLFYLVSFLVIFYFSFFSGNTHFSIPIYAVFSIIPFLTRYLVEKEKKEETEKQIVKNI
jgi:hypothetical protein